VEHRFSGAFLMARKPALAAEVMKTLTSGAKAQSQIPLGNARLKACSTHPYMPAVKLLQHNDFSAIR